jgi:hypothetical protein
MGPMRSSPYQVTIVVRWLSEVPNRPGRQIVGKARSRLIPGSDLGRLSTSSISSQLIPSNRRHWGRPAFHASAGRCGVAREAAGM